MADQGLWFKLWCAALSDPDLDNLDIADFGRWAKLGAYVKQHGTGGVLTVQAPARALCALLQVPDFPAFHGAVSRLPNVHITTQKSTVSDETVVIVSFHYWLKYQGDLSTSRVRKFREMKRLRREEKRREENKEEVKTPNVVFTFGRPSGETPESTPAPAAPGLPVPAVEEPRSHPARTLTSRDNAPRWDEADRWLFDFLTTQDTVPVPVAYLNNPTWWAAVAQTTGGLSRQFLSSEF